MDYAYDINRIARRQMELGLTNAALAAAAGLHPATIANVLTGRTAKGPTVMAIAAALGLELAELVVPAGGAEVQRSRAVAARRPARRPAGGARG